MLRRLPSNTGSSPPESQGYSQSFSQGYSQGDLDASQKSLGEEASTALVAMGGMGLIDTRSKGTEEEEVAVRRSSRNTKSAINLPELVVEGIVGKDSNGVFYSPQKFMFTYNSASCTHEKQVDKVLSKAVADFNKVPDCFASRFKTSVKNYTGGIPSVVGGLTNNYKNKVIPTGAQNDDDTDDEVVVVRAGKRTRKQ